MNRPLLIGQRLNSSSTSVAKALGRRDSETIAAIARRQAQAGADYLDLNAAALGEEAEPAALGWLVEIVQQATETPLCLDSQNPAALRSVLPLCRRPPILNAFSGAARRLEELLAVASAHPSLAVVAVCYDERGTQTDIAARVEIGLRIAERLCACGVAPSNIILDPVTLPVTCGGEAKRRTLETLRALRQVFPPARLLCAVGNFSFGLTRRRPAERAFAADALAAGADVLLCDVLDSRLTSLFNSVHIGQK